MSFPTTDSYLASFSKGIGERALDKAMHNLSSVHSLSWRHNSARLPFLDSLTTINVLRINHASFPAKDMEAEESEEEDECEMEE